MDPASDIGTDERDRRAPVTWAIPRWALALLAGAILFSVFELFAWLERRDPSGRIIGQPARLGPDAAGARVPEPIPMPIPVPARPVEHVAEILRAPDPIALRGRPVLLDGVRVEQVVGNFTFWIGPSEAERVPVVLRGELMERQPEARVRVEAGDRVRISGMVRALDDLAKLGDDRLLSAGEKEALRAAPVYVSADRVEVVAR